MLQPFQHCLHLIAAAAAGPGARRGVRCAAQGQGRRGAQRLHPQRRHFSREYQLPGGVLSADEQAERLSPADIVKELDQYVIGQSEAKEAVAVALRERWRRLQLPEEKSDEVTPKNILISGPSGCGKTEIIRRVSKLLRCPFVKVDASTFTRRGIVGASVTDMIVDLYDRAEEQSKTVFRRAMQGLARKIAEDIVVACMHAMIKEHVRKSKAKRLPAPARKPKSATDPASGSRWMAPLEAKLQEFPEGPMTLTMVGPRGGQFTIEGGQPGEGGSKGDAKQPDPAEDSSAQEAREFPLESVCGVGYAEVSRMPKEEAEKLLRQHMLNLEKDPNSPSFSFPELRQHVAAEAGSQKAHVAVSLRRHAHPRGMPPFMLPMFSHGEDEGGPEQASVADILQSLGKRACDALTSWQHDESRSPVRDQCERWGIVCIDEIDKVVGKKAGDNDRWMNTDVQQELLTLIEGTKVDLESARATKSGGASMMRMTHPQEKVVIDTTHILFVCAGAFVLCKPKDMLVELLGRLPIRIQISALSEQDMIRILRDTKYPLTKQQTDLFATEGVTLEWDDDAVREIARVACQINDAQENTGARVLHGIVRAVLAEWSFQAPSLRGQTLRVDREMVRQRTRALGAGAAPPQKYVL